MMLVMSWASKRVLGGLYTEKRLRWWCAVDTCMDVCSSVVVCGGFEMGV